jgi:hypothetical protein
MPTYSEEAVNSLQPQAPKLFCPSQPKRWISVLLIVATYVGILGNILSSLITIAWAKDVIQRGFGAVGNRLEMGMLFYIFFIWPIAALVGAGLIGGTTVAIVGKGKPKGWAIATWSLTALYFLEIAAQLFLLLYH